MTVFPNIFTIKSDTFKKIVNGFIPSHVVVPSTQNYGEECKILVKQDDVVKEGQIIAQSKPSPINKTVSYIYAPIPGVVEKLEPCLCPNGRISESVRLRLKGSFSFLGKKKEVQDIKTLSKSEILSKIEEAGIVNTFTPFEERLLVDDIKNSLRSKSTVVIVRLFDEDPSRSTDCLISKFFYKEVQEGAFAVFKAFGGENLLFVRDIPKDKEPVDSLSVEGKLYFTDANEYPSGLKKGLVDAIRTQESDKSLRKKVYKDCLFLDASTCYEVYRCLSSGMPVMERYVYITGSSLQASALLKVRLGTSLRAIAEMCGGFTQKVGAIVVNGMVSGVAASSIDAPVTKYVKSVSFLSVMETPDQKQSSCIRCGACRQICPYHLSPDIIYRHLTGGLAAPDVYIESARLCDDCGLCNSVCPSRLQIGQRISDYNKTNRLYWDNVEIEEDDDEESVRHV